MIKGEYVRTTSVPGFIAEGFPVHTGQVRLVPTDLTSEVMAGNMGK